MKDNKNLVIGLLCTVLCIMAVAYAAFGTTLTINGTASIDSTWDVAISNIQCTTAAGLVDGVPGIKPDEPTYTGIDGTAATIDVKFNQPGDTMNCTVTLTNNGSLDAVLTSIEPTTADNTTYDGQSAKISDFIWYTLGDNTDTAKLNNVLAAKGSHTYTIKAEYKNVVDGNNQTVALPKQQDGEQDVTSRQIVVNFNYKQNLTAQPAN